MSQRLASLRGTSAGPLRAPLVFDERADAGALRGPARCPSARATSGLTLVELMLATPLLFSLLLLLGHTAHLAWSVSDRTRTAARQLAREALLEVELARGIRAGVPLPALSLAPDGQLVEGVVPGALQAWAAPAALVLRTREGHSLITRSGDQLVRYALGAGGRVDRVVLLGGLREARFAVERDARGAVVGASWDVTTSAGRSTGFAGQRLSAEAGPRSAAPAPTVAPRWTARTQGGGR